MVVWFVKLAGLLPFLDQVLRYGLRSHQSVQGRYTLTDKVAWTSFYLTGFLLNSLSCLILSPNSGRDAIVRALWGIHLARRLGECLFLHRFSQGRKTMFLWSLGMAYYVTAQLTILVEVSSMTSHEEKIRTRQLADGFGVALFVYGNIMQHQSHRALAHLEPVDSRRSKYGVPRGGWFEYIACPHYLAEILVYVGLGLLRPRGILSSWIQLGFVVMNLSDSALQTRAWYRMTFDAKLLPRNQKGIFPLVL